MNPENIPVQSVKSLMNASLLAALLAAFILFVAVLPAEYGIDPTGLGHKMGLTTLSEVTRKATPLIAENCIKPEQVVVASPAPANPTDESQPLADSKSSGQWKDIVKIVIPPKKGLEYKFSMQQDAVLEYSWVTDGASIYFDFHGEPKGAKDGYFKSYQEIKDSQSKGKLTAPFEGIHGWYWENETEQSVTIQLSTNGNYQVLGVMK